MSSRGVGSRARSVALDPTGVRWAVLSAVALVAPLACGESSSSQTGGAGGAGSSTLAGNAGSAASTPHAGAASEGGFGGTLAGMAGTTAGSTIGSGGSNASGGSNDSAGSGSFGGNDATGGGDPGGAAGAADDAGMPATCDGGTCFCDAARSCTATQVLEFLPLGSRGYRICPTAGDGCVVKLMREMEGGGAIWNCEPPSPPCVGQTWPDPSWLDCELVQSCNFLLDPTCTDAPYECPPS